MNPDNRFTVQYGLPNTEYLADSSGNDAEIDQMILIYRGGESISQSHLILKQLLASRTT